MKVILPQRSELVLQAREVGSRGDSTIKWRNDENTTMTNVAFGAITRWLNETFFAGQPRSFALTTGMTERELFDQVYRAE